MVLCAECRVSWDTEFGPLVTGYSATWGNDDSKPCFICCSAREVGNFAEVGFSEPGLDYCRGGGGPTSVFCFGISCMWVQRLWRSSCVWVCQRVPSDTPAHRMTATAAGPTYRIYQNKK